MKNVVLKIARINVGVLVVIASTASATVTQVLDAPSASKPWSLADGNETKLCSTCNLLCRAKGCGEKEFVDGSDTKLCSTCLVEVFGTIINPNKNDVLCGCGERINGHTGNVKFKDLIHSKESEYLAQNTNKGKNLIAARIVSNIRAIDPAGRFLKKIMVPGCGLILEMI